LVAKPGDVQNATMPEMMYRNFWFCQSKDIVKLGNNVKRFF